MPRPRAILLSLAALLPLAATTLERLSLEQMTAQSTAIVRAHVAGSFAYQNRGMIYTVYRVQTSQWFKGAGQSMVEVSVPGGTLNGLRQTVPGAPVLENGAEYLLFLWTSRSGITQIMGLSQGLLDIKVDASGNLVAYRAAANAQMVDAQGRPVKDTGFTVSLDALSALVGRPAKQ